MAVRHSSGLSLEEMKAIAAEAGLDSDLVEKAARLTPVRPESPMTRILGGPVWHELDAHFPASMTEERAAHLLAGVRAIAQQQGEGDASASGMSWHSVGDGSQTFVTANNEGSGTRVRVTVDRRGGLIITSFLSFVGSVAFGVVTVLVFEAMDFAAVATGWAILGGGIAAILAAGRAYWVSSTQRFREKTAALMDMIDRSLGEH